MQHVISIFKWKMGEQVFSPCSKNSVYHPFHSKPHNDYLKKTLVDVNCIDISDQSSNRAIYIQFQMGMFRTIRLDHTNFLQVAIKTHSFHRYDFVRVHRRFLKIIR